MSAKSDTDSKSLFWAVLHPFAALSFVLSYFGGLWDPILGFLAAHAGSWFSIGSIFGSMIAPNVPWIPTGFGTAVLVGSAALYGTIKLDRLIDNLQQRVL